MHLLLIPIERQIAFDPEFKNKDQRDVKLTELLLANSDSHSSSSRNILMAVANLDAT